MSSAGCTQEDQQIKQHQRALRSLEATTQAIADAWLAGNVSGTYAETALEQTIRLLEQERAAVVANPGMLIDPRGASFADSADHIMRVAAQIISDVRSADGTLARRHLMSLSSQNARAQP